MKSSTLHLAAFGGTPEFIRPLHVGHPNLLEVDQLAEDLVQVLRSGYLTNNGPRVREFEQLISRVSSAKHCIAVCNATTALQIAAKAMDLHGEVIVPSFTFIATPHAMKWIGLEPVFADVNPESHTLDPDSVERCISEKTTAIVPVHLWGNVCHTEALQRVATRHGLRLLYDSSHAFGCSLNDQPVGSFGDAEVFSFHATKFVHSVEGGAIVTNDDQLADRCRRLRAFGITGLTEISDLGINGKMHELSAAVGLRTVAGLPVIQKANESNRHLYQQLLHDIPGLHLTHPESGVSSNRQYVVITIDEDQFGLSRDQVVSLLRSEGVFARSYFAPGCHRATPYADQPLRTPLPVTERLLNTVMQLPTGLSLRASDIMRIGKLIQMLQQQSTEIQKQLMVRNGRCNPHPADPARMEISLKEAG
ncbi:MAG: DegT/DnrJ/EryC1/StrS family aminotransferase [Planctomyces sp.]|nr:DegT/DnrJ/EryC1/StrS family aminotransferase [Planctomyces sp.]